MTDQTSGQHGLDSDDAGSSRAGEDEASAAYERALQRVESGGPRPVPAGGLS